MLDQFVWLGSSDIRPCCALERKHPKGGVARTVGELLTLAMAGVTNAPPPDQWTVDQRRCVRVFHGANASPATASAQTPAPSG
jgi:hypothetical protein